MSFEIWRHRATGERYLVNWRHGAAWVAAGPLGPDEEPRSVLETHSNQHHNPRALLAMRKHPEAYVREFVEGMGGKAVPAADPEIRPTPPLQQSSP